MTERRALVVGASGLVGSALYQVLPENQFETLGTAFSRPAPGLRQLDLRAAEAVTRLTHEFRPSVVFLVGAFTSVDRCEEDPDLAYAINVGGAAAAAQAARGVGAMLVFASSDYVFDGKAGPYAEDDEPAPLQVYGRTKLAAEHAIQESGVDHLIVRTTDVFGWNRTSKNFAMTLWERLAAGEELRVPSDQITTPTLAENLAEVCVRLVDDGARGIVDVVGGTRLSRAAFAAILARTMALDASLVVPTRTADLHQTAPRPLDAGLKTERLESILGTDAMALDEALKRFARKWRADTYTEAGPRRPQSSGEQLKREILDRVRDYHALEHQARPFVPFQTRVGYAGRVYGAEEMVNLVDASLDFWLTLGPYGELFERKLRTYLGSRDAVLVNSGSSANLTAIMTLTSPQVEGHLESGDEVITPAATFPTTLAPIVQAGLVPVFVDCEVGTYNIDPSLIEAALSPRTRAMMIPHTLGNPFALDVICDIARRHGLFLVEDSCDALGATFDGKKVGTYGDLGSLSFYPAHQMTMGEGGAVIVNQARYSRVARSIRDWGRDCWCAPGESNTCGKRFGWCLGTMPTGYDHKYMYSNIGFNLKPTDMQAAIGVAQIERVPGFVERRRANFASLFEGLREYDDRLILPRADPKAEPSWFGFPLTVREGVSRRALVQWLEGSNIETRDVFGGNILRQPGYSGIKHRVAGPLPNTDRIAEDTFFIGVYPGLTDEIVEFMVGRFKAFFDRARLER